MQFVNGILSLMISIKESIQSIFKIDELGFRFGSPDLDIFNVDRVFVDNFVMWIECLWTNKKLIQ